MQGEEAQPIKFSLKAYTKKELRLLYGIPKATFIRWLKEIPETAETTRKNWLSVNQVAAILRVKGVPGERVFH